MISKVIFLGRASLPALLFLFFISCKKESLNPYQISEQYIKKVLFFEEGFKACVNFLKNYAFEYNKATPLPLSENKAKKICSIYENPRNRFLRSKYKVYKIKEGLTYANYRIFIYAG